MSLLSELLCKCRVIIGRDILIVHIRVTIILAKALEVHELFVLDFSCDINVRNVVVNDK
jgi:hypothetical protein